jgi:hypothetical protein
LSTNKFNGDKKERKKVRKKERKKERNLFLLRLEAFIEEKHTKTLLKADVIRFYS